MGEWPIQKMQAKRGRPVVFSRERALDCAVDYFWRHGFEATDVASIAQAMGMTKPSLYRYFGDKNALFAHALRHYQMQIGQASLSAFLAEGDIKAATQAFLATAIDKATEGGEAKGCFLACIASGVAQNNPQAASIYSDAMKAAEDVLRDGFQRAVRAASLRADFPSAARARLAVDLVQANAIRARLGESSGKLLAGTEAQTALILG